MLCKRYLIYRTQIQFCRFPFRPKIIYFKRGISKCGECKFNSQFGLECRLHTLPFGGMSVTMFCLRLDRQMTVKYSLDRIVLI